jgi:hypothetical protein
MKELEDYRWFPQRLRRYQMDFIGCMVHWLQLYRPLVPIVAQLMQQRGLAHITDYCSGSGAPALYVHQKLAIPVTTLLTDKFPQPFAPLPGVEYAGHPMDVLNTKPNPQQFYSMYNAFHHFTANEQKNILQGFANLGTSFCIAEILEPGPLSMAQVLPTTIIGQLLVAPFIKPFSWGRLLFTYLLPINLFTVTYDGIVSVLKSKSVKTYSALIADIQTPGYTFTVKKIRQLTGNITYITGHPNT